MANPFDDAVELQLDLFRAARTIDKDVLRLLLKLEKELTAEVGSANYTAWGKQRINKQLAEARSLIKTYYDKTAAVALEGTSAIAEVSARATALSIGTGAVLPSAAMLEAIASQSVIQGAAQGAWWAKQSEDTAFRFAQAVRQGLISAETNQQIIRRVTGFLDTSKANAAALVQTSVATVANDGRSAVFAANDDIIKRYRAVATLDTHTCERCAPLDGLEWDKQDKGIGHNTPKPTYPLHFNCLTGDALVSSVSDVTGNSKRWFDGKVVVIQTAAGRKLTCTPNHPILTGSGWIAAGSLNVGGNVICDGFSEREGLSGGDHKNVPPTIHDFIEAFLSARQVSAMPVPVSARDFHGDGAGSKIAVVYAESLLGDGIDTALSEHSRKPSFIRRLADIAGSLFGLGGGLKAFDAALAAANRAVSFAKQLRSFGGGECGHSGALLFPAIASVDFRLSEGAINDLSGYAKAFGDSGLANAAFKKVDGSRHIDLNDSALGINTSLVEAADDGLDAYARLAGELLAGSAGSVFADEIIDIEIRDFSGHVYNLETEKGWYVANGIVTHNCRCLFIPEVFDAPRGGQRASSDGPVSAKTTFSDWLEKQSKERQEEFFGPGRAALYRSGKITLADLTNGSGSPLTLDQLRKKYA